MSTKGNRAELQQLIEQHGSRQVSLDDMYDMIYLARRNGALSSRRISEIKALCDSRTVSEDAFALFKNEILMDRQERPADVVVNGRSLNGLLLKRAEEAAGQGRAIQVGTMKLLIGLVLKAGTIDASSRNTFAHIESKYALSVQAQKFLFSVFYVRSTATF